jgi:hypothetical protein
MAGTGELSLGSGSPSNTCGTLKNVADQSCTFRLYSTDFQVDFTNVPSIPDTTITYTLIINQDVTPYMVTDLTVNTVSQTIKWANATEPEGNPSQIDIVGLMFVFGGTGSIIQTLGQMGTFA